MSLTSLNQMASQLSDEGDAAPVHLWDPPFCGDIDIEIRRDGSWWHEGGLIKRPRLAKLFSSILLREDDDYFLVTPAEKVRIRVEDSPFFFTQLRQEGDGEQAQLFLTTTLGQEVRLDAEHPLSVGAGSTPHPLALVRANLFGLISRAVFYELVDLAQVREANGVDTLGVWSAGEFFLLGVSEAG